METLTHQVPTTWGDRSGVFSSHNFEYFEIALKGGEIRSQHPPPTEGEATLEQVFRNNRSFLQILARDGEQSDQVATATFGLSGGVETIDALAESITRGLGQVEIRHYGETVKNQINIFIESDDLDPMFLLARMIDAPKEVYANIEGLKAQVEAQELRRKRLLESPRGKGRFFGDIFYQRVNGDISPLEVVDGTAEFAWGYWVRGGELWNQGQSMGCLALDLSETNSRVDSGMRDSLLDPQKFLVETPKGKRRFVIRIDAHPTTEECCPRATNFQMGEANFYKTAQFESAATQIRINNAKLFPELELCSKCHQPKNGSGEGAKCLCQDKES